MKLMIYDPPKGYCGKGVHHDFPIGCVVMCMGEIENMPGHLIIVNHTTSYPAKWYFGLHAERFREPTEDEI